MSTTQVEEALPCGCLTAWKQHAPECPEQPYTRMLHRKTPTLREERDAARAKVKELEEALNFIAEKKGKYSTDPRIHAENTMDAMQRAALEALGRVCHCEEGSTVDCRIHGRAALGHAKVEK